MTLSALCELKMLVSNQKTSLMEVSFYSGQSSSRAVPRLSYSDIWGQNIWEGWSWKNPKCLQAQFHLSPDLKMGKWGRNYSFLIIWTPWWSNYSNQAFLLSNLFGCGGCWLLLLGRPGRKPMGINELCHKTIMHTSNSFPRSSNIFDLSLYHQKVKLLISN